MRSFQLEKLTENLGEKGETHQTVSFSLRNSVGFFAVCARPRAWSSRRATQASSLKRTTCSCSNKEALQAAGIHQPLSALLCTAAAEAISIMSQQLTKLPGARCAANCASHGLNQVKSQPSSQRTAPWKRVGNSRRLRKAADRNSSLLFLRFSSTLSCCGMRTASSSDAPPGQKASGHVA